MRDIRKSKRKQGRSRPDAQRAIYKFKRDTIRRNLDTGEIYLTRKQACEVVARAVLRSNPAADVARVAGMVAEWWFCEG